MGIGACAADYSAVLHLRQARELALCASEGYFAAAKRAEGKISPLFVNLKAAC